MGKITGFTEFYRKTHSSKEVKQRIGNYNEFIVSMTDNEVSTQGARCMDCGTPFCQPACPLGNIIPDWNDKTYQADWRQAYFVLNSTNNFPDITGRVCPAPCESACVLGINKSPVAIKSIEYAIAEKAWKENFVRHEAPLVRSNKKVLVIGSGPAGLACADQSNKDGHHVVVLERADRIGGLLRYGIPDFKLEKSVVDRHVKRMEKMGVRFEVGIEVGKDVSLQQLREQYDAVVIAIGSTVPRNLSIEGRNAKGVHFAMEFLTLNNKIVAGDDIAEQNRITAKDKTVVVIGGGDTGSDCVGTSIRQGAKKVIQIELLPQPPLHRDNTMLWPKYDRIYRTSSSQAEGCSRYFSILVKSFLQDDKKNVTGIACTRLEWNKALSKVMPEFKEIEQSDFVQKADLVLLAMGFLHPEKNNLLKDSSCVCDKRGNIQTNHRYTTNLKDVFAAGDARTGQSLVVSAISEGRECARQVDIFLNEYQKNSRIKAKNLDSYQK